MRVCISCSPFQGPYPIAQHDCRARRWREEEGEEKEDEESEEEVEEVEEEE